MEASCRPSSALVSIAGGVGSCAPSRGHDGLHTACLSEGPKGPQSPTCANKEDSPAAVSVLTYPARHIFTLHMHTRRAQHHSETRERPKQQKQLAFLLGKEKKRKTPNNNELPSNPSHQGKRGKANAHVLQVAKRVNSALLFTPAPCRSPRQPFAQIPPTCPASPFPTPPPRRTHAPWRRRAHPP